MAQAIVSEEDFGQVSIQLVSKWVTFIYFIMSQNFRKFANNENISRITKRFSDNPLKS